MGINIPEQNLQNVIDNYDPKKETLENISSVLTSGVGDVKTRTDFLNAQIKAGQKITDKKKEKTRLTKERTAGIKGADKFTAKLNLQETGKRTELDKQFKDRFDKKSDVVKRTQAKAFTPEKITLVSEGKGDRTVRSL